jgi:hypothetical protein
VPRIASLLGIFLFIFLVGCGSGTTNSGSNSTTSGGNSALTPSLVSIAPATVFVGTGATQLIVYGSNFDSSVQIQWNGSGLSTKCVDSNLALTTCSQATELLATVPANDFAAQGTAKITVSNQDQETTSSPVSFNIVASTADSGTSVRAISKITAPNDIVWDATHEGSTNMTQLALPSLTPTATAVLANPTGSVWFPGDLKAAPVNPHTAAVTLIEPGFDPEAIGGVVVFDDNVARPESMVGWARGQTVPAMYDTLAWSSTDSLLAASPAVWDGEESGPLFELQANTSGLSYLSSGLNNFNQGAGNLHSDFGTGFIYSDNGNVANPQTGTLTGSYGASGLVAPDSSLNRTFILGQTAAQVGTNNYTIQSFDERTFNLVSSITVNNISGAPVELVRWGSSGLAVLTSGGVPDVYENGLGMLYLIQDSSFVSGNFRSAQGVSQERAQHYWTKMSKREQFNKVKKQSRVGR